MSRHRPAIERHQSVPGVTVDRDGRGAGTTRWVVLAIAAVALGVGGLLAVRLAGPQALHRAESVLQALAAELGLGQPPAPAQRPPATAAGGNALQQLHAAIARGERESVLALVPRLLPQDLNTPVGGMTALMRAASAGDAQVVRALLASGANPNARGSMQRTALQYAAEKNRLQAATLLLDAGADVDGVDSGSLSPLVMAADRNYTEFALMLIARGANVNLQNVDGYTALMDAAEAGNPTVVRALLDAGARTGARHRNGWTALDFARGSNNPEVLRLLAGAGAPPAVHTGSPAPARPATSAGPATAPAPQPAAPPAADAPLPPKKGQRQ